MNEANNMFNYGLITLTQRARAEQIYVATCLKARELFNPAIRAHRENFR